MKNTTKIVFLIGLVAILGLSFGGTVFGSTNTLTANAGSDLYLASGQTTTLQGSGYDPNGYLLSYSWSCTGGILSSYNVAQPIYTVPNTNYYSGQSNYTCTLTVKNSYGVTSSDSTTIFINYYNNIGNNYVQTNSPTYIKDNSATLNGYVSINNYNTTTHVWFEWGANTNYGNSSFHQTLNYSGSFFQNLANLTPYTSIHYRAVAETNGTTIYGQDMAFSNGSGNSADPLLVTKKVIDISSKNLNWQSSVNAKPGDILSFQITLQAGNKDVHNVVVRDFLPTNLIYKGNLLMNATLDYTNNPISGITIGTIPANGISIVTYQAKVAPATSFTFGTTTLSSNATVSSTESGTQTVSTSTIVTNTSVQGATILETGVTNNPITDSFLLPVMLIILGSWIYFSGNIYKFSDWLGAKLN